MALSSKLKTTNGQSCQHPHPCPANWRWLQSACAFLRGIWYSVIRMGKTMQNIQSKNPTQMQHCEHVFVPPLWCLASPCCNGEDIRALCVHQRAWISYSRPVQLSSKPHEQSCSAVHTAQWTIMDPLLIDVYSLVSGITHWLTRDCHMVQKLHPIASNGSNGLRMSRWWIAWTMRYLRERILRSWQLFTLRWFQGTCSSDRLTVTGAQLQVLNSSKF